MQKVSVPLFGAISEIKKYIIHTSYSSVSVPLFGAISEIALKDSINRH